MKTLISANHIIIKTMNVPKTEDLVVYEETILLKTKNNLKMMKNHYINKKRTTSKFVPKSLLFASIMMFMSVFAFGQIVVSGGTTGTGSYATLSAAITAINGGGALTAPVVVNVPAGFTQTIAGRITLTMTGTVANTITIQKSGAGANPLFTAHTGVVATVGATSPGYDAMFVLRGCDYVTIDGIDMQEAAANTTATTQMEYGYVMARTSSTDGCQNNTIKNCAVTLNRVNTATCAIAMVDYGEFTSTAIVPTSAAGTNSYNKFYTNTIKNTATGIFTRSYAAPTPFTLADTGNDFGGTSAGTGNIILNFGGGGATASNGIFINNQWGANISYNQINNNNGTGVNHANILRGIFMNLSSTSASATCNNNTIVLHSISTANETYGIHNELGNTAASNTVDMNNNDITADNTAAAAALFYGIYSLSSAQNINIKNNNIHDVTWSGTTVTGVMYPIFVGSTISPNVTVYNNTINNITRSGTTGGTTIGIYTSAGTIQTVKKNTVTNITITGTGTTSTMYGIQTTTGTIVCDSNTVNNISCVKTSGTGLLYGIYNIASPSNENYNYNTISNITHAGTGTTYGLTANTATGTRNMIGNKIFNVSTAGTTVAGISSSLSTPIIRNNKIYGISSSSAALPTVSGIILSSTSAGAGATIRNNIIGNLTAPNTATGLVSSCVVRGLNITATTASVNVLVDFNTIYIDGTSTNNFSAAAIFQTISTTATSSNLTMRNNIYYNNATANGVGIVAAYRRSATGGTNYNVLSDKNIYYGGSPSASQLLFYDGTNVAQDVATMNTFITGAADDNSYTENVAFMSTTGSSSDFLKFDPTSPSLAESGGSNIAGITDDYAGTVRQGNAGYTGTGSSPDVGAWEEEGTATGGCSGTPATANALISNATPCATQSFTLSLDIAYGLGYAYQWQVSTTSSTTGFSNVSGATNNTLNTSATVASWYRCTVTCVASTLSQNSAAIQAAVPAAMSGTYTIDNTLATGSGNYASFAAAQTDLNCRGISGPVTFNVTAGQVFTGTGGIEFTFTGTASNTITFQKFGAGANPKIQRNGTSGTTDYIVKLTGVDYYTFNGIDFEQNGTSATDWVEYGIWITNASITNGATYNVFKNGVVTMSKLNINTRCGTITSSFTPTSTSSGTQTNNKFLNMLMTNSYSGYYFIGSTTYNDQNNEINNESAGVSEISNIADATLTGSAYGIFTSYQTGLIVQNTLVHNINCGSTSLVYGITCQGSALNTANISNNSFYDIIGGGTVYGIYFTSMSTADIYNNKIYNLTTTTATSSSVRGIYVTATGSVVNMYNNIIYNIQSNGLTTTTSAGIDLGTGTFTVYNNMISGIKAPASTTTTGGTKGISISGGTSLATQKIYNNTIYLSDVSTVASYTSAGIGNNSTTPILDLRNNIVVNTSNISTAGTRVAAFWKTATTDNVDNNSDNNLYYAGTPDATHNIYYNGTTAAQTILAYNSLAEITPGELASKTENVTWNGANANGILKLNATTQSNIESGGQNIALISSDFEGTARTGYPLGGQANGGGTKTDMGADEFDGTPLPAMTYVSSDVTQLSGSVCGNTNNVPIVRLEVITSGSVSPLTLNSFTTNGNGTSDFGDVTSYRIYYTGNVATFNTTVPVIAVTTGLSGGNDINNPTSTLTLGTGSNYFWLVYNTSSIINGTDLDGEFFQFDLSSGTYSPTTSAPSGVVTVNVLPSISISPASVNLCNPGATAATLTASGAVTYTWASATGLSATTGTSVTALPTGSTTYTITGTAANTCTNTASVVVSVNTYPTGVTATATPANVCSGNTASLASTGTISGVSNIGVGTTNIGGNNGNPYRSGNGGTNQIKTQLIYTAAEMSAAGMAAGPITALAFTTQLSSTGTISNFEINLANTATTALTTTFETTPLTQVFTQASFTPASAGLNTHTFNGSAFSWDGVSNLLVQTCQSNNISGTATVTTYAATNQNSSAQGSTTACSATVATLNASKPIVQFTQNIPVSYAWAPSGSVTTPTTQNTTTTALTVPTTYTVTATNAGCSSTATTTVNIAGQVVTSAITSTLGNTICSGQSTTLNTVASVGGAPYTYSWAPTTNLSSTSIANPIANPTSSITYTVTVSDVCGTTTTASIAINVNTSPTVTVTPNTGSYCNPGTAVALAAGGADTYVWANATGLSATTGANVNATPTTTTTYTVTGTTTVTGCTGTASAVITVTQTPIISSVTATPSTVCSGNNSSLLVSAPAVTLAQDMIFSSSTGASLEVIASPTVVTTTTTGTIDDGFMTVTPSFTFPYLGTNYTTFNVGTNGYIIFGATTPSSTIPTTMTTHTGYNGVYAFGRDGNLNTTNSGNMSHGAIAGGKYVFEMNLNAGDASGNESNTIYNSYQYILWGSTSTDPGKIEIVYGASLGTPATSGAIGIRGAGNTYRNAVDGSTSATAVSATYPVSGRKYTFALPTVPAYTWSPATFLSATNIANPVATAVTTSTIYTVTATANGCSTSSTRSVDVAGAVAIAPVTSSLGATICTGQSTTLTAIGSIGGTPYTYAWGASASLSATNIANPIANPTTTTTYTVTVSDACGTTASTTITINVNPVPTASASASAITCLGSDINFTGTTNIGTSFSWAGPNTFTSTSQNPLLTSATSLATGTYTFTATANGCSSVPATVAIVVNPLPTAISVSSATNTMCAGGTAILLTSSGGNVTTNSFVEAANTLPTSFAITNTSGTGTATLNSTYFKEGTGSVLFNTASTSANVSYGMNSNVDLTGATSAQLTFSQIAAMEGVTYSYDIGYVEYSTNAGSTWTTFPNSSYAGAGTLITTQATATAVTGVIFSNKSYTDWNAQFTGTAVTPGTGPATTLWKNETINVPAAALTSNQFRVRFRYTTDGSSNYYGWLLDDIKITKVAPSSPTWANTAGLYTNAGASVNYTGSASTTVYASPTTTTTYTVTATSASGCTATTTKAITVNALPAVTVTATPVSGSICLGGSATLAGNNAASYVWSGGISDNVSFTPGSVGSTIYTVTATGANGCTATTTKTVVVNGLPTITATSTPIGGTVCSGQSITLAGGGAASYTWSGSVTDNTPFTSGAAGATTYTVTGTSAAGCINTTTKVITVNGLPTVSITSTPTSPIVVCNGDMVTLSGSGASTYSWSGSISDNVAFTPPATATTTYTVTGTDGNGCSATSTKDVTSNVCSATLNLTTFIEGYYDAGAGEMRTPLYTSGTTAVATDCDYLTVELHDVTSTVTTPVITHTYTGILNKNGTISCTFPGAAVGNSYYIVVYTPNSVKTWSAAPVSIGSSSSYNFTSSAGQAYGSNQVEVSTGKWACFSGDLDHANSIDLSDYSTWQSDFDNFISGYSTTDIDGDAAVGLTDYVIWQINFDNFIGEVGP